MIGLWAFLKKFEGNNVDLSRNFSLSSSNGSVCVIDINFSFNEELQVEVFGFEATSEVV